MSDFSGYFNFKARFGTVIALAGLPLFEYPFNLEILAVGLFAGATTLLGMDEDAIVRLILVYAGAAVATSVLVWLVPGFFWNLLSWACCVAIAMVLLSGVPKPNATR